MSFISKLKEFMVISRVGGLLGFIIQIVRLKIDKNGNGAVSVDEVMDAIPTSLLSLFVPEVVIKCIPIIITLVIDLQKAIKKD